MQHTRLLFALLLLLPAAHAQRTTANLYGIVQDPSSATVANAAIRLTNEQTAATLEAKSNERGEFTLSFLPPGLYTLEATAPGFKTFRKTTLRLESAQQTRLPIALEVGANSEQITVTSDLAPLQDASPTLNDRLSRLQIAELPQSRRDFTQLLILQPGIRSAGQGLFSFNGLASGGSNVTVDGVDGAGDVETNSTGMFNAFNFINVLSQEAISEVNTSKGVYSADTARTFGGNINLITRGGTNQFHGSLFENWQNDILNSRYALLASNQTKPAVRFNQFGGSFGGPIIKNRLFFFGVYEGYRQSSFVNLAGQVPTPELKAQAIAAVPAYKDSFALWPNPNEPYAANALTGIFRGAGSNGAADNHAVARVDYRLNDTYQAAFRYRRGRPTQNVPAIVAANARDFVGLNESGSATLSRTTSTWTGETRFGFNLNDAVRVEGVYDLNRMPVIALQGAFSLGAERLENHGYSWSIEQTMLRVYGKHVLKFGGMYFHRAPRRFDEEIPLFTYPNLAALLANRPSAIRVTYGTPNYRGKAWETGFFFQDDFRIRPNLILNLGLRWEYYSVYRDTTNTFYNPDGIAGALQIPIRFRPQAQAYDPDRNNFAPRVGLAWTLDPKGRNVIRTGFGMAYGPFSLRTFASSHYIDPRIPFRATYGQADVNQYGFKFPFSNEQFAAFARSTTLPTGVVSTFPGLQNPQNMQWSFDYQRQITSSLTLQTGYVGNKATHVTMTHAVNQPNFATGIRPFPSTLQFTSRDDADFSRYHAWQSSLRKRLSHGITFNTHYTWSRVMAIANGDFWLGNDIAVQDETNWRSDYGPTSLHVPHVFSTDAIYEIPSPIKWLKGFQLSAIFTASSGSALNATQSSNRGSSRPDYIGGDVYLNTGNRFQFLNRAAFSTVPVGPASGGTLRPGNFGKNALLTPTRKNWDLSIAKSFSLRERFKLQIRAEAFNAFNTVNLGGPITDVNNANFGRILAVGDARRMQLNMRLTF
ncbi:MAG: TonB-dependent receptor [Acidobacteria bacterium]|nr:TonB-dependent receptor [Acidobacteriota bacterium]